MEVIVRHQDRGALRLDHLHNRHERTAARSRPPSRGGEPCWSGRSGSVGLEPDDGGLGAAFFDALDLIGGHARPSGEFGDGFGARTARPICR
jgi:hypothetical protein